MPIASQTETIGRRLQIARQEGRLSQVTAKQMTPKWKFPMETIAEADAFNDQISDVTLSTDAEKIYAASYF